MNRTLKHFISLFCLFQIAGLASAQQLPAASATAAPAANGGGTGPKLQFEANVFDFGKVSAGDLVKHTFTLTNTGDTTLEIINVQPGCGCTTAGDWSRKIEPGQTGTIPIQFNSANFNGQVSKTVTVTSNDRTQPSQMLQIKGTIWRPIEVSPQYAILNVIEESPTNPATVVRIVNNTDQPLKLETPESSNKAFEATVKTTVPDKEYELLITSKGELPPGNAQSQISVKTSMEKMPEIKVTAWANVQKVLAVNPPQLILPPGPLGNKMAPTVMIENHGTNQISISSAELNVTNAEVQIKEINPGRSFSATVTFNQGFEIIGGQQQAALTIKTSHPRYSVLRVPVMQMPRPGANPPPQITRPISSPRVPLPSPEKIPVESHTAPALNPPGAPKAPQPGPSGQ